MAACHVLASYPGPPASCLRAGWVGPGYEANLRAGWVGPGYEANLRAGWVGPGYEANLRVGWVGPGYEASHVHKLHHYVKLF